jgi:hypothetical protein
MVEMRSALEELIDLGLITSSEGRLSPHPDLWQICSAPGPGAEEALLGLVLTTTRPVWLLMAAVGGVHVAPEFIPDAVDESLSAVIPDPARREAFLLERARVVDAQERSEVGAEGELMVVDACVQELVDLGARELSAKVRRVSLVSDELGYDITAPRLDRTTRRIEVKASRTTGKMASFFVTRNEARVGISDGDWALVVVRVRTPDQDGVVGWLTGVALRPLLPSDQHAQGHWETARVRLPIDQLTPGIPPAVRVSVQ